MKDLVDCKQSYVYREFMEMREEILKHKWIESQKAGRDVGFEWAFIDWMIFHRNNWIKWKKLKKKK